MKNIFKLQKNLLKHNKLLFCQKKYFFPEVEEVIVKLVKEAPKCEVKKFDYDKEFEEYGFDSLDVVELIVAFEENLGYDIPNEDAENNIKSVKDAIHVFSRVLHEKNEDLKQKEADK